MQTIRPWNGSRSILQYRTLARMYSPAGHSVQMVGITPDIVVGTCPTNETIARQELRLEDLFFSAPPAEDVTVKPKVERRLHTPCNFYPDENGRGHQNNAQPHIRFEPRREKKRLHRPGVVEGRLEQNEQRDPSAHYAQQTLYNTLKDFDAILNQYGQKDAEAVIAHLQDSMEALVLRRMRPRQVGGDATRNRAG